MNISMLTLAGWTFILFCGKLLHMHNLLHILWIIEVDGMQN